MSSDFVLKGQASGCVSAICSLCVRKEEELVACECALFDVTFAAQFVFATLLSHHFQSQTHLCSGHSLIFC